MAAKPTAPPGTGALFPAQGTVPDGVLRFVADALKPALDVRFRQFARSTIKRGSAVLRVIRKQSRAPHPRYDGGKVRNLNKDRCQLQQLQA